MNLSMCPLCGKIRNEQCYVTNKGNNGYIAFHCETYNADYMLSDELSDKYFRRDDDSCIKGTEVDKLLNLAVEYILRRKNEAELLRFSLSEDHQNKVHTINLGERLKTYPVEVVDVAARALENLGIQYPKYGESLYISPKLKRLVFENPNDSDIAGTMHLLFDFGYLTRTNIETYEISATGWQKIDELHRTNSAVKQAFIAMSFGSETKEIREAFRKAIEASGYDARIIDEKEHNHQILPEILYEIKRSKFVVVDVTYPNYGTYYEAGYAQGLEKEVIICCRKDILGNPKNKPHFDIAQKSMVVWESIEDLESHLKRRIEATVH